MDKNIIPPPEYGKGHNKYNFSSLNSYGDVIFFDVGKDDAKKIHAIRDAAYKFSKYHKIKIATRFCNETLAVYHAGNL